MIASPTVRIADGVSMPQLGYGLYKVPAEDAEGLAGMALAEGYRSLDTAAMYGNEAGVGRAIRASSIARSEVFVTTKVWNTDQGFDATLRAFDQSREALGLDVVDLYLIHWPAPARGLYIDTYHALERLLADGRVRAIGVSNFQPEHLRRLAAAHGVSTAQTVIRWHLDEGTIVIPKASSSARIRENADVFAFELTATEREQIAGLDRGFRSGSHPDTVN